MVWVCEGATKLRGRCVCGGGDICCEGTGFCHCEVLCSKMTWHHTVLVFVGSEEKSDRRVVRYVGGVVSV